MTSQPAGSDPATTNQSPDDHVAGDVREQRLAAYAGLVLSAVLSQANAGGDRLTMGVIADVVEGVLLLSGAGPLDSGGLAEIMRRLVNADVLEQIHDEYTIGHAGRPALSVRPA